MIKTGGMYGYFAKFSCFDKFTKSTPIVFDEFTISRYAINVLSLTKSKWLCISENKVGLENPPGN
jgi:hypothetical protein